MKTKFEDFLNQAEIGGYTSIKIENVLFEISKRSKPGTKSTVFAINGSVVNKLEFETKYNEMVKIVNPDFTITGYIKRIESNGQHQKNFVPPTEPYPDDMYDEPKTPKLIDVLADIEIMFYKYEKALIDGDFVTALKYKEAILKIKAVTLSV